jgi:hypothetical protein
MLAGAYLLGYTSLWLTGESRPRRLSWHIAAAACVIGLALSTSRSGALMLVGGLLSALLLVRSRSKRRRRLSQLVGLLVVPGVAVSFAVVGATGWSSLFDRFGVWSSLLESGVPLFGFGIGSAGAATYSRVAEGPSVFVDNYFVSLALQLGPLAAAALVGLFIFWLAKLRSRSPNHPGAALHIALLAGLACSFLVLESWEYAGAMFCLALFAAYGFRLGSSARSHPVTATAAARLPLARNEQARRPPRHASPA